MMNNYRHVAARAVLAVMALGSCAAQGAVSDETVQRLLERIESLEQRIAELERPAPAAPAVADAAASVPLPAVSPAAPSWTEKVTLQGDLRYRYENIDVEQADSERNRQRIRARAAIIAKPEDRLEVGFGLSTSENGDPISSNQTIGSGGSRKDIYLDLAYFNWNALQGLNVVGGKYKNFLYRPGKHSLLWDGDWNPEGLGLIYARGPFFANLIGTWLESDSNKAEEFTFGGQVGASQVLGDDVKVTGGVGYFRSNTAGKPTFFGGTTAFSGNSFDALNNVYLYDYEEVEVFGEIAFMMGELPVSLFADFVQNQDADRFDTGWAAGVQLGTAKKKGGWEAGYAYQDLEPDAVLGLLTDSDFGGGGTDNKGHVIRGAYALSDKWNVAGSYFINTIDEYSGTRRDYDRLQLDLNVRY